MKEEKLVHIESALSWLSTRPFTELKSIHEDHEDPQSFNNKSTGGSIQPDVSFRSSNGGKNYLEIALKTDNVQALVTKWKLLSTIATMKKGKLFLMSPKGHKMFTQRLVGDYSISAKVYSI